MRFVTRSKKKKMHPYSGVTAGRDGVGSCLGAPNENGKSWAFGNLNKTIHVSAGFLNVSPFKLDLSLVFYPKPHAEERKEHNISYLDTKNEKS